MTAMSFGEHSAMLAVVPQAIPARAGIGLRAAHYRELLERLPDIGWCEVHSENYFGAGGQPLYFLEGARANYPVSLHGVGMSLGSADALDRDHLRRLKSLIDRVQPALVSEHLCWSSIGGRHLNDLLPLPYTEEALEAVCDHIDEAQNFLGRQILVENVTGYLRFAHSTLPEWEFVAQTAARTGCGILLDVNNVYVNSVNHSFDSRQFLRGIPVHAVQEIHLAGFDRGPDCLIDTHAKPVADEVWALYRDAVARFGKIPTLIEWDAELPALDVLLGEANQANRLLEDCDALAA